MGYSYSQSELHRHLDVSTRSTTLLELAQKLGLESTSTSLEAFRSKIWIREPMTDLAKVLAQFTLFQKVLNRPESLERIAFEALEDCRSEGLSQVEFRFSPSFVCESGQLNWDDALNAFEKGLNRALKHYPEMHAGLICIASRDYGVQEVDRTVEFFLKNKNRFIGLDLAGNEAQFPCRLFEKSFKKAVAAKANITIHAGEAAGPENIWEAIELLGARRIGHGIACVRDPRLLEYLRDRQICLEMCPTSNWLTQSVTTFEAHPLPKVLRAGIPVCINTDDPGIFGVTYGEEIRIAQERMGLTQAEINLCSKHAARASFLPNSDLF